MAPRTEAGLLQAVLDLAELQRWSCHHDRPARRSGARWATAIQGHPGFPDLCISRHGVVRFRELKGYDKNGRIGRLSSEQRDWGAQLSPGWQNIARDDYAARAELLFDVWTPNDWPLIVATLTAKTPARTT